MAAPGGAVTVVHTVRVYVEALVEVDVIVVVETRV